MNLPQSDKREFRVFFLHKCTNQKNPLHLGNFVSSFSSLFRALLLQVNLTNRKEVDEWPFYSFHFAQTFLFVLQKTKNVKRKENENDKKKFLTFIQKFNIILFEISELWLLGLNIENQFLLSIFVHFQCSEVILFDIEFFSNFVLELSFFFVEKGLKYCRSR